MTNTRKLLGAAAFSVALAGGGVAGALLGTPGSSGAQETTTTTADDEVAADGTRPHRGHRLEHLEAAAAALDMTADELRAALEAGQTIAEVASDQGVDVDVVIDAIVADATDELRERVTAFVNGEAPLDGPRHHRGVGGPARLETVATALGVTTDELRTAIEGGQSIADVAAAEGVDVQTVIDTLVAEATEHLDQAVADGRLTQEEADAKQADLEARITELVNHDGPFFRRGRDGGPRP